MKQIRRVDLIWQEAEITYEKLKKQAEKLDKEIPQFIKEIIETAMAKKA